MITLNIRLFFSLLLVFVLTIIPMPEVLLPFRPPWLLLFALYIQFYLPVYFNVTLLLLFGLCLDVLLVALIGEHAFALLLTASIAAGRVRRFTFFSIAQQMTMIGLFCALYQLIIYLVDAFQGFYNNAWMVPGTVLLSICLWPWIRVLADKTLCYDLRP